jgi:RND family efflux transporter MFP subunit
MTAVITPPPALGEPPGIASGRNRPSRRRWLPLGVAAALVVLVLLVWKNIGSRTTPTAPSIVAVAKADREDIRNTLTIAAEFRPYQQVSLHSKVAGFLQTISVDVGDHVKEGQALAQLDVPEIQSDFDKDTAALRASEEELKSAEATYSEVHLASERLLSVAKDHPKLVAQQDVDTAQAKERTAAGAVGAARQRVEEFTAAINRSKALLSYSAITAPFEGVITKRYVDPGALIQAGTTGTQAPIVDIDQDTRLRLVFPVPESAVAHVAVGASVHVFVSSLNVDFTGQIARFSGKIDRATRTMSTEVDVDNADLSLKPGMYADATLVVQEHKEATAVPTEAIAVGAQPSVLLVTPDGVVEKRNVKLGLQTPDRVEITAGLQVGDQVIVGSRAGVQPGQKVIAKVIEEKKGNS